MLRWLRPKCVRFLTLLCGCLVVAAAANFLTSGQTASVGTHAKGSNLAHLWRARLMTNLDKPRGAITAASVVHGNTPVAIPNSPLKTSISAGSTGLIVQSNNTPVIWQTQQTVFFENLLPNPTLPSSPPWWRRGHALIMKRRS